MAGLADYADIRRKMLGRRLRQTDRRVATRAALRVRLRAIRLRRKHLDAPR